jgi:hypothetical protein
LAALILHGNDRVHPFDYPAENHVPAGKQKTLHCGALLKTENCLSHENCLCIAEN